MNVTCKRFQKQADTGDEAGAGFFNEGKHDTALLYLDSAAFIDFFEGHAIDGKYRKDLMSFYENRKNSFVWINSSGINEYARNFVNLLNHEDQTLGDQCILFPQELQELYYRLSGVDYIDGNGNESTATLELILTVNFFDYASRNWRGWSDDDLNRVGWFIRSNNLSYEDLLDSVLKSEPHNMSSYDPLYRQYGLLKNYLQRYNEIESSGGYGSWEKPGRELRKGDTGAIIAAIKEQLFRLEDLQVNNGAGIFDDELHAAVRKFQRRHGLNDDGILSKETLHALSIPVHVRIQQLMINMERCRWVPSQQKGDYLVVNIPDFKLFVRSNDSLKWSCNVIVGKSQAANNTVIFNANVEFIVFSPYWNVPENILLMETLPEIKKDTGYLRKHNMEVVDRLGRVISTSSIEWENYTAHFPYIIRQRPGENNALGQVKFLFPNPYDIYMHDTPERSLFGETNRAFSHGCIRIEKPYELAAYLLRNDSAWDEEKILARMNGGRETFVKLKSKVPVFIAYFTSWVDREGLLNFRDDIYHHDEKMRQILFSEKN